MSNFDDFLNKKKNEPPRPVPDAPQPSFNPYTPPASQIGGGQYAGQPATFDRRLGAFLIDTIAANIAAFGVGIVVGLAGAVGGLSGSDVEGIAGLLGFVTSWLYYAVMESSSKQATLGKLACGLVVTDMQGQRIGFGKATGRYFGKIISGLILCIGFLMCIWTQKKQCLHDMMAGCLVIRK